MNPYAPITPDQERQIREYAAATPSRHLRERILDGLLQLDQERAADRLRRLRGEPAPAVAPAPPVDQQATRAANAALRAKLDASFAGRAMQPVGLGQPSLYAGYSGTPYGTTR